MKYFSFHSFNKEKLNRYIIWLLIIIGVALRFTNLNWDGRYFFHPDERNIADAVYKLDYTGCLDYMVFEPSIENQNKCDLNPNFFAYGALPMYIVRFFATEDFDRTLILLRIQSAVLSTLLIPLFYKIGCEIFPKRSRIPWPIILATFIAVNPGLIQFAHFGTFEMFLTFEYSVLLYALIKYLRSGSRKWFYISCLIIGSSVATKVVSLAIGPIPFIFLLIKEKGSLSWLEFIKKLVPLVFRGLLCILITAVLLSPYMLIDFKEFMNSMNYEGPVANGSLSVFYTQQFIDTIPVLYQFTNIFPFILGVFQTILFVVAFPYLIVSGAKDKRNKFNKLAIILIIVAYGAFHFSLFVKWTRYMLPLVPFMLLINTVVLAELFKHLRHNHLLRTVAYAFTTLLILTSISEGWTFYQRYLNTDAHILARDWTEANIPEGKVIIHEPLDVGVIPLNEVHGNSLKAIELYDIDSDSFQAQNAQDTLKSADYFIILANRIYPTRFRLSDKYPFGYDIYKGLNDGSLGYHQLVAFNRVSGIINEKIDLEGQSSQPSPDETFNVFDNPTIIIYKRNE